MSPAYSSPSHFLFLIDELTPTSVCTTPPLSGGVLAAGVPCGPGPRTQPPVIRALRARVVRLFPTLPSGTYRPGGMLRFNPRSHTSERGASVALLTPLTDSYRVATRPRHGLVFRAFVRVGLIPSPPLHLVENQASILVRIPAHRMTRNHHSEHPYRMSRVKARDQQHSRRPRT